MKSTKDWNNHTTMFVILGGLVKKFNLSQYEIKEESRKEFTMRRQKSIMIGSILTVCLLIAAIGHAELITASSTTQSDVQSAINMAVSGDVVVVPSGSSRWNNMVTIPSHKKITLQGAGPNSTIITKSTFGTAVDMTESGSRLTGFQFVEGGVIVDGDGWRIDNCILSSASFNNGIEIRGNRTGQHPTGLVDHNDFTNLRVAIFGAAHMLDENNNQHVLWSQPLNLGSGENVVYVEDNTFRGTLHSNAVDSNYGGYYVFRYNTLYDTYIETHSVQGDNRASRKWEIYNNTINQVSRAMWVPMYLRGGTGVVFNNTLTGTWTNPNIALDNVRSCYNRGEGGLADGSSPWDGNELGEAGYPARDQIGRSTDQWLWTDANPYPPQALEPAYAWNNKHGGNDVEFFQHDECAESVAHIQPNRDYYNNVQMPGYAPYTYPHPLIQVWGGGEIVQPPKNLRIKD